MARAAFVGAPPIMSVMTITPSPASTSAAAFSIFSVNPAGSASGRRESAFICAAPERTDSAA